MDSSTTSRLEEPTKGADDPLADLVATYYHDRRTVGLSSPGRRKMQPSSIIFRSAEVAVGEKLCDANIDETEAADIFIFKRDHSSLSVASE